MDMRRTIRNIKKNCYIGNYYKQQNNNAVKIKNYDKINYINYLQLIIGS